MDARPPPTDASRPHAGAAMPWRLGRIEIRSKITAGEEVIARVELVHAERGRLTELAVGSGGLEAGFAALARILGVEARLERLSVSGGPPAPSSRAWQASACASVRCGPYSACGSAVSDDLLSACLGAYLEALVAVQAMAEGARPAD